jgi:hypothetical protein
MLEELVNRHEGLSDAAKRLVGSENLYDKNFVNMESPTVGCRRGLPCPVRTVVWSSRQNAPAAAKEPVSIHGGANPDNREA